jgi:Mg2+-importing ATPase
VGVEPQSLAELLEALGTGEAGLSSDEAAARLSRQGPNRLANHAPAGALALLLRQFTSPIILILIGASILSFLLDSIADGLIILLIVLASGLLGFWQEHGAARAIDQLLKTVQLITLVLRDGQPSQIPSAEVVVGDVVLLSAGVSLPADCRVIRESDLSLDEAALTGESYPVSKHAVAVPPDAPLAAQVNRLHLGTHVVSGTGLAVVVATGRATAYGAIAERLRLRPPETDFERGVRRFGQMLLELTLLLIVFIFAFNVYLRRPVVDSFMFALALGVGLTPQLLPAVISVNLAQGAKRMARRQVIVKRLAAIENFGSMDVLCADKTGTLTQGSARVHAALGVDGRPSQRALLSAYVNASFESGFDNPIDAALRQQDLGALVDWQKLDEVPFDFARQRQSVLVVPPGSTQPLLITKGALAKVLEVCSEAEVGGPEGTPPQRVPLQAVRAAIEEQMRRLSASGYRVLGVAERSAEAGVIHRDSEHSMIFLGLIALEDPLKPAIGATVAALAQLGVRLKLITGDNALVAARIGREAGLSNPEVITGSTLLTLSDAALRVQAASCDVFAEVEPNQKERLINALRQAGHVVGFLGDGINDAPALHAADVGVSVQGAVDVAKEAADIVLLDQDLAVLAAGIREGRRTFANTLKYVFIATSANFGNMFSMAGASLLLPFLPLLPKQVLLNNLLTDLPEMTMATDRVDADWIERPRRWNIRFIQRFMLTFGLVSSVFDYLTFAVLLWLLRSDAALFRTGWFVESVVSAATIVLVVRTRGPLLRSRPSRPLLLATVAIVAVAIALPFSRLGGLFGLVPLPPVFLVWLGLILALYTVSAEAAKRWFYRRRGAAWGALPWPGSS